ncbi:hypothetical protein IU479_22330 [Nocardia abscessus]|nr:MULTISPECIES: hypothetical protein [Nocardia]MBF6220842.1 hypothetical protein [Nocardia abscessus]
MALDHTIVFQEQRSREAFYEHDRGLVHSADVPGWEVEQSERLDYQSKVAARDR